jgi:hypothetical protein
MYFHVHAANMLDYQGFGPQALANLLFEGRVQTRALRIVWFKIDGSIQEDWNPHGGGEKPFFGRRHVLWPSVFVVHDLTVPSHQSIVATNCDSGRVGDRLTPPRKSDYSRNSNSRNVPGRITRAGLLLDRYDSMAR